ncbi:hypothetical protein DFP94_1011373 [Fontibacillus phaseoli]|uniref:Uncharacterized protein n=1 Tax=Fontibacillus phaseoli TaxID=1416533 RepID=A0A369BQV2_9BACL|nr:hypothetical protein [Fontibacillus phaseoli]RCX23771.1 hypothetical protein DFP94_1011373 [Fontibacillus phaseoli]
MRLLRGNKVLICTIKGKTIKNLVLIDLLLGTGMFFVIKIIGSSIIIASIGSMACSEGVKWKLKGSKLRVIDKNKFNKSPHAEAKSKTKNSQ